MTADFDPDMDRCADRLELAGVPFTRDHLTIEAACPVHDPAAAGEPSLRISVNGNGPKFECAAGCPPNAIEAHVEYRMRDRSTTMVRPANALDKVRAQLPELAVAHVIKWGAGGEAYELGLEGGRSIELGSAR